MKNYKIILLGSQCSGKSTIISYLQDNTDLVCIDHDEEIKRRHDGTYPKDQQYVANEVQPSIEHDILAMDTVVYSASFWGLGRDRKIHNDRIELAIEKGFSFVYLQTDTELLHKRNVERMAQKPYDDASGAFDWYRSVYENMLSNNYFTHVIDTDQSVDAIASELLAFIEKENR